MNRLHSDNVRKRRSCAEKEQPRKENDTDTKESNNSICRSRQGSRKPKISRIGSMRVVAKPIRNIAKRVDYRSDENPHLSEIRHYVLHITKADVQADRNNPIRLPLELPQHIERTKDTRRCHVKKQHRARNQKSTPDLNDRTNTSNGINRNTLDTT